MWLIDKFRQNKSFKVYENLTLDQVWQLSGLGGRPSKIDTPGEAMQFYLDCDAVSTPVNKIVNQFAIMTPVLVNTVTGKRQDKHPILDFLRRPSPFFTTEQLQLTIARSLKVTGRTFAVMTGNPNYAPLELEPIAPNQVSQIQSSGELPVSFIVAGQHYSGKYDLVLKNRRARYIDAKTNNELLWYRLPHPTRVFEAMCPLMSATDAAIAVLTGGQHNVSLLRNGGRLSLAFNLTGLNSTQAFRENEAALKNRFSGPENAGQIFVSNAEKVTVQEFGKTNVEMDFVQLMKMARQALALTMDVPIPLIDPDRMTMDNYAQAKIALYDDAVIPLANEVYGWMSDSTMPRFGLDPLVWRITFDPQQVTALRQRNIEEIKARAEIPMPSIETLDEIRELLGSEPVEGGDKIYQAAGLLPLGEEPDEPEADVTNDLKQDDEPDQDDDNK